MARQSIKTEDLEPDPARSYERAKPEKEAGMGRMDDVTKGATPTNRPDHPERAADNAHPPRQLNAEDAVDARAGQNLSEAGLKNPVLQSPEFMNPLLEEEPPRPRKGDAQNTLPLGEAREEASGEEADVSEKTAP